MAMKILASKKLDLIFCGLMAFAAAGHLFGTFTLVEPGSQTFVWSLAGVLAAALLVALNVMRVNRPNDRTLSWVSLVGCLCWVAIALLFGSTIGNIFDFRVLVHTIAALGLAVLSWRTLQAAS